ncbi:glycosyltransferase [Thermoclostridium stercorarium subsp. thermolacticum DSM 2910]|uniref:Glycosyltransferase n=1 Tax=Thermoclostridium stercorarium subsp. thermolacticum DSM 2910 TaxID=1121336 RepID=A0A1B1YA48_THEST|nr:hypothetical protein [Thermoclostridium stercorarium]ANW97635.1 glycosyltransferase [Thermoclostridium stercorarium subsp. thermolacticum DSM 2910]
MRYISGVAFAVAAFILVFLCIPETGVIYTHDTQAYEYAAETFLQSGTMRYFGYDTPIIQWPPFYILILAVMKFLGITVEKGAAWLNAGLFAYLVYVSAVYLFENLTVKVLSVPALLLLTLSVPLIYVSGYGWTEMLFIFLAVLSMVLILMYLKNRKLSYFVSGALVSAMCWLTRYIGITVIAALALVLFIYEKPVADKFKKAFTYGVFSCFPMCLWVLRNYLLSGTFTGGRQPGVYTLGENIELSLMVFNEWFSYAIPEILSASLVYLGLLVLLAVLVRESKKGENSLPTPDLSANLLITAIYSAVLLYTATKTAMDGINNRLWAPVYPFLVFAVVFLMDGLLKNIERRSTKGLLAAGFIVFAFVFSINPALWIRNEGFPRKYELLGIKEAPAAKKTQLLELALETIEPSENTLVISNDASALNMHTNLKSYYPPKKEGIPIYTFEQYVSRIKNFEHIYVIWSGAWENGNFVELAEFEKVFAMEKVAQNSYCVIFRLK